MKKILFALLAAVLLTACNTQFAVVYGVKLDGRGDGQFEVSFPQGSYAMDGTAAINLIVGDSIPLGQPTTKADVIEHGNARQLRALQYAQTAIAEQFNATEGTGTYDIWLSGFIKETATGLVFEINRHFTSNPNTLKVRMAGPADLYPYIK